MIDPRTWMPAFGRMAERHRLTRQERNSFARISQALGRSQRHYDLLLNEPPPHAKTSHVALEHLARTSFNFHEMQFDNAVNERRALCAAATSVSMAGDSDHLSIT